MYFLIYYLSYLIATIIAVIIQFLVDNYVFGNRGDLEMAIPCADSQKKGVSDIIRLFITVFLVWFAAKTAGAIVWNMLLLVILIGGLAGKNIFAVIVRSLREDSDYGIYENAVVTLSGSKTYRSIQYYAIQDQITGVGHDCRVTFISKYPFVSRPNYLDFNHKQRGRLEKLLLNHRLEKREVRKQPRRGLFG